MSCTHPPLTTQPEPGRCACGQRLWAPTSVARGYCEHCRIHHQEGDQ